MEYEKIHACPNNCCLYRKEFANAIECPECGQSRWKNVKDRNEERKQILSKVIWYFPPIPRFKRLFRSIECAENLTCHASERIEDGKLRHPADSPAWKLVDFKWPDFGSEPRNLRLTLSADGVNPHGTLLNIPGKSKDGLNARRDLVDLKLRPELAPISSEKKISIPPTCYTFTKEKKRCVLKTLSRIKVPEGYPSNIRNLVSMTDLKLNSLKSHDFHVLIQQLFPIAIRSVLPKHVRYAITRLCILFNFVCNKVLDAQQLDKLEEDIVVTLCLFEKYFPPSFFTIMIHLTVHIVREVKLWGPIYHRWMYPFERFMKVIENSVRNRYRPEGCIAESYLIEEAIEFCSDFLSEVDPVGLGTHKSQDHLDTSNIGRPLSMGVPFKPEQELLRQAHRYVLENTIDVQPYEGFATTISEQVSTELEVGNSGVSDNLRWIAHGPHPFVITYSGYAINGCRYHTNSSEKDRSVQNSGVSLVAKTMQVSSSKDKNPVIGDMSFYGVIQEIWELNYNTFNVSVFKCDWLQNSGGVRIDELGYTLVDLNRVGHKSDSFILASQVK
ncbi:transposase [Cucumis melo var. makuwa]|uniref:Transposase n=2 Tax=Cucumis melo var. makuwa TaxID=1194695 RepID=A0A5D3DFC4_CUCMM|nr:transposase [Cucumis melo var. makuwa]TYK22158.1 transposase [Cucumis melo var. makuwa]